MPTIEATDDHALLEAFRASRNESAFATLVHRHLPLVFHTALRRLGSPALAEEAAQAAFCRLAAKAPSVARHPERLRAWLCRTAYFEACKLARKESRLSRLPMPPDPDPEPMHRPEIYDRLDEALNRLPELDRELVLRHCCDGEEYREIAAAVGKSAAACQKRVQRALAVLGRGIGGAKTASVSLAAFAVSSGKSSALPAAERIAAVALEQSAVASGVAGAISGTHLVACAVLVLAGGAAGWQRQEVQSDPPEMVDSAAARPLAEKSATQAATRISILPPRPEPIVRSLDDVLESIQVGRIAPLIDFLPNASPDDLRTLIEQKAELYQPHYLSYGAANLLALRRWTEIDPAAALKYALPHFDAGLPQVVLIQWLRADPSAAMAAYLALPVGTRRNIASGMAKTEAADVLAAADPEVTWVVARRRMYDPVPPPGPTPEDDERVIADLLAGTGPDEPEGDNRSRILSAFARSGTDDPDHATALAQRIRWPELRAEVLWKLQNPSTPLYRPGGGSPGASGTDLWTSLDPTVVSKRPPADGILDFAGRKDPRRTLAMLPEIAAANADSDLLRMTKSVLAGWLCHDAAGAIRWAAAAGVSLAGDRDLDNAWGEPEALVDLMANGSDTERKLAMKVMPQVMKAGCTDGTIAKLIEMVPPETADRMVAGLAGELASDGSLIGATELASLASPEYRLQTILPDIGLTALNRGPEIMNSWLCSLPAADRNETLTRIRRRLDDSRSLDPARLQRLRQILEQVQP